MAAPLKSKSTVPPGVTLKKTFGGDADIFCISWSPDGRLLASGSDDNTVRLWDAASGKLLRRLEGHKNRVYSVAFSPDGRLLASASLDRTVRLWDAATGQALRVLKRHNRSVNGIVFSPDGRLLASASSDKIVCLWDAASGKLLRTLKGHKDWVCDVTFNQDGHLLASASGDETVCLWDAASGNLRCTLEGHKGSVLGVAFSPDGCTLASASLDHTVRLWDAASGTLLRTLEGHKNWVRNVAFSPDGRLLASYSRDQTVRLWRSDTWDCVGTLAVAKREDIAYTLAFHSTQPLLATFGEPTDTVCIWELDLDLLMGSAPRTRSVHYVNAKVVLLGDTGVGKSGLVLALTGQPYRPTDSTHGRHIFLFERCEEATRMETRETLLWDLAGQPGYRLIHQMHLGEVAVALVVFDARSETDPLAGVRHWDRALRQARQRQGDNAIPLKKFLVAARTDRGGTSISKIRITTLCKEMNFDGYFETSAKEGWGIAELQAAVRAAIDWDNLPRVTSDELFQTIKQWLLDEKEAGRLISTADDLYRAFFRAHPRLDDPAVFETCLGLLENRDLIRRLTFGRYILLQPELLDAYASSLINAAREEPDGFGAIAEEDVLAGRFRLPEEARVRNREQEWVVLLATVEELLAHDLALREPADDGRYLVFPSQFARDWPEAPDPPGRSVTFAFEGPVQNVYVTLAVRLAHSGQFSTKREAIWRNAAIYQSRVGGECGLYLREFADAQGELTIFFARDTKNRDASEETRYQFEKYVHLHLERYALAGTIRVTRSFVCAGCRTSVPDVYAAGRLKQGNDWIECGVCNARVSLADPTVQLAKNLPSSVDRMDKAAQEGREFGRFLTSVSGEARTEGFASWIGGGPDATLAVVFTDVVGSTALAGEMGDERMNKVRKTHFAKARELIGGHGGREVKTLGDGFLAAFRSATAALDFAVALQADTGHPDVAVRSAIHVGPVQVQENDVFGMTVDYAARVLGQAVGAEIWLSEDAKKHIDLLKAERHRVFEWKKHEGCKLKGFKNEQTLWSIVTPKMKSRAEACKAAAPDPAEALRRKVVEGRFDVFLSYNSEDRGEVKWIAERLKKRGLQPWLDEWEIQPDTLWQEVLERQMENIHSAAVFVGANGIGPWQDLEMRGFLMEFIKRRCPVIPVYLASCNAEPDLPPFLRVFHCVDFRKSDPDPLNRLIWGITGRKS